ncbi:MAG: RHS repeat-associated core domain-containing protein [Chloroflexi bacterium]|nr:RHS repeat-associated core domain-containing protein [Chloroflexota bacterium]
MCYFYACLPLAYDADCEAPLWGNRLVGVTGPSLAVSFVYDGDGKQVKAVINPLSGTGGETTLYVGQHYEVTGSEITKYYFAGSQRIAFRKDGDLNYLLSDHLGSSSITTDSNGNPIASMLYKAWGETRYSAGTLGMDYQYTGQRKVEDIGLYFYNARWYDPALGRFAQADTIIPQGQGVQAWDRYAYTNNNPVRYNDPTGHCIDLCVIETFAILTLFALFTAYIYTTPEMQELGTEFSGNLAANFENAVESIANTFSIKNDESEGITVLEVKGEYIPPSLKGEEERSAYREAIHRYKDAWGIPRNVDVPHDILDDLAEQIKNGKSPVDAVDAVDGPPEADEGDDLFEFHHDNNQNHFTAY